MDASLELKRWLESSMPSLIDGIDSADRLLTFLRAKDVLSDEDCEEILAERGDKQRVELCLLKVLKHDAASMYHNLLAALSLPYPQLYATIFQRLEERFGTSVLQGLPAPQFNRDVQESGNRQEAGEGRSLRMSSSSSSMQVLKVRLEYQQEVDLLRAQLETLQTEMADLKAIVGVERREKDLMHQDMRSLEHQYRTAKREREEAIKELDQRVKERYDMQQRLQGALSDLDEVTAKNDGLNMQLQQFGVVMQDRDEACLEVEKIKRQRDQVISDRKNLVERKAQVEAELESTLLRYEEAIKEGEGKSEEQKKLMRELMKVQMEKMELQLENSKMRKDLQAARAAEVTVKEHGVASPRDSGVSGDMRGWDQVKLKITLAMSQEVLQEKRHSAGIVLETGVFVKELVPEGIAAMDGQLVIGDQLLEVNYLELDGRSVPDVTGLIRSCKSDLVLTVQRVVPRAKPVHISHPNPMPRYHSAHAKTHNTRHLPAAHKQRYFGRPPPISAEEQEDDEVFRQKTLTLPHHSGYNPLSHHTSDNVSLRSFAYNPNNRPYSVSQNEPEYDWHQRHVSQSEKPNIFVSASIADFQQMHGRNQSTGPYHSERIAPINRLQLQMRRRSLSTPDQQMLHQMEQTHPSAVSSVSQASSGTVLAGRMFSRGTAPLRQSPLGSKENMSEQKQATSASQNALFRLDSSDSDMNDEKIDGPEKHVVNIESCHTSTTSNSVQTEEKGASLATQLISSPSVDTLNTGEPQLLSSGFPMVGSSLTTTDMRLALRGPEILISPSIKASTKEARRTSTKMPTFLKDPKMADVKRYSSHNCRFVELKTSAVSSDIGFSIIGGRGPGIFVSAIHEEIHTRAGLRVGDQILELNGIDLTRSTYEKASATLSFVSFGGGAVMCVEYNETKYHKLKPTSRDDFYVRALFDYHPEPGEMAFRENDILHVIDSMYEDNIDAWLVTRLARGRCHEETGCVPSKSRARVLHGPPDKRNSSFPPQPLKNRRSTSKQKTRIRGKMGSLIGFMRMPSHEESRDTSSDSRFSQRSTLSPSPDNSTEPSVGEPIVPVNNAMALFEAVKDTPVDETPGGYEYVKRVSYTSPRPVLVVGPLASAMANRLMQEDPMKYSVALPEFLESYSEVQEGLQNHSVIYCSRRSAYGNYACITSNVIRQVAEQNQHCLLDVGPACIPRLIAADLKPIVLFLAPKSERKLRSCCMQLNISAVEAHSMYVDARRVGQEYQGCFSAEVSLGSSLDRCMLRVRDVIQSLQVKVDWVVTPE